MNTRAKKNALTTTKSKAFLPRLEVLQQFNGQEIATVANIKYANIPSAIRIYFDMLKIDLVQALRDDKVLPPGKKNHVTLGTLLSKAYFPQDLISKMYAAKQKPTILKFSTRYKDILSAFDSSPHFVSCANKDGSNNDTALQYLQMPHVFVLIGRDKFGNVQTRFIGRLMNHTRIDSFYNNSLETKEAAKNKEVLVFNRCYGVKVALPPTLFNYDVWIQDPEDYSVIIEPNDEKRAFNNSYDDLMRRPYIKRVSV